MRKPLRIPVAIAFVLTACGDDGAPCTQTKQPCVQDPRTTEVCPENVCVDNNTCPTGCIAASEKRYCVPDGTDAGVCPQPSIFIVSGQSCPAGCTPVG
jgi:hypothetical protein